MSAAAATVRTCGPDGGSAVADDGTEVVFDASAVDPVLRALHPGQRVHLRWSAGRVDAVTIAGLPLP